MDLPISNTENFEEVKKAMESYPNLIFCKEINAENVKSFIAETETFFNTKDLSGKYLRRTRNLLMELLQDLAVNHYDPNKDKFPLFKIAIQEKTICIYQKHESYSSSFSDKAKEVIDNLPTGDSLGLNHYFKKIVKIQKETLAYPIYNFSMFIFDTWRRTNRNISYQITPNSDVNPTFELLLQLKRV